MTIEVLDLGGDAYVRGKMFGAARREPIGTFIAAWLDSLRDAGIADPLSYIDRMLAETSFLPAIRKHAPDLMDEVRGIAAGAAQSENLLLAVQLLDEEWAYRRAVQAEAQTPEKCSSVGIDSGTGTTWIGQNMDLGGYTDGHQILLRLAPSARQPGALIFSMGGMIGLLGVNAYGVGVCVNSLPMLPSARSGLPVAFMVRKILQAQSAEDAFQCVRALPHATAQHYLIAGPGRVRSFEASSSTVVEYTPVESRRVLHTNHPLVEQQIAASTAAPGRNTVARLHALNTRLLRGDMSLESIKAALSSCDDPEHPVCRRLRTVRDGDAQSALISFTTGSMISVLCEARAVESWVSAGPPSINTYTRVLMTGR